MGLTSNDYEYEERYPRKAVTCTITPRETAAAAGARLDAIFRSDAAARVAEVGPAAAMRDPGSARIDAVRDEIERIAGKGAATTIVVGALGAGDDSAILREIRRQVMMARPSLRAALAADAAVRVMRLGLVR